MRFLSHVNAVPLIEILQLPAMMWLVSEYCVRGSLSDLIYIRDVSMDADFKQIIVQDILEVPIDR